MIGLAKQMLYKSYRVRWEGGVKYVSPITNEEMIGNLSHSLFHLHCLVEAISENNSIRIKIQYLN